MVLLWLLLAGVVGASSPAGITVTAPESVTAGTIFIITVAVYDQSGHWCNDANVTLTINGTKYATENYSAAVELYIAGMYEVTATTEGLAPATTTVTVVAAQVVFGMVVGEKISVMLIDRYGNQQRDGSDIVVAQLETCSVDVVAGEVYQITWSCSRDGPHVLTVTVNGVSIGSYFVKK